MLLVLAIHITAAGTSIETELQLDHGMLNIGCSIKQKSLHISYSSDCMRYQFILTLDHRMGLLIEVYERRIASSLIFLSETEIWPTADTLEEEYSSKALFEVPGWVVVIVQKVE